MSPFASRLRRLQTCLAIALCLATGTADAQGRKRRPKPRPRPQHTQPAPAPPSEPTSIPVSVVEIAGTQAYVKPGSSGGVLRGAKVTLHKKEYAVVQTTASYALIDTGKDVVREGDKGEASIVTEEQDKPAELPKPRPLDTWKSAWKEEAPPASTQTPRYVPLGADDRDRRWDVRLSTAVGALLPLGRGTGIARAEINARVHAEPFQVPLAFDLDLSLQRWFASDIDARAGADARPTIWLREALVGYGKGGYYAGIGRMRYAASTLGALDGTRVRAPLGGGFTIGAFGGGLPHPLSGAASLAAQRFGIEGTYSRPDLDVRPEAALVMHGSTFEGSLDERRVSGMFGLYPGHSRFGGHFEVSSFDRDNPWRASPIELTAAGLDASIRAGIFQIGGRFDLRQPVRSRWLASFLPTWWFCRTVPAAPGAAGPQPCDGSVSTRALGAVDAGIEAGNVRVTVGATTIGDLTQTQGAPDMKGGFASARVVRIARVLRVDASGSYSVATYLDMYGGSAGPGVSLFDDVLDLGAYYRNATLRYRADVASRVQHGFGGTAMLFPSAEVLFTVQGEAITGDDANALMLFGTAMWRPRF